MEVDRVTLREDSNASSAKGEFEQVPPGSSKIVVCLERSEKDERDLTGK